MRRIRLWQVVFFVLLALSNAAVHGEEGPLFDYREVTLENGLRVITLEDFSCPMVAVELWYHVGSKDDPADRQGFAHMFEHMMFRGTDRLGPTDHYDIIRRGGGSCNASTSFDRTVYVERLPAHQLELALWLEAERMAFLKIDQDSFDTERKVVEEEIRLYLEQPYMNSFLKALAEIFQVHPYRWSPLGEISHLRAAATQELRDFWMRYYVPNNATLVIVGAVTHQEAQKQARRYFGWIDRAEAPPRVSVREPMPTVARTLVLEDKNAPAPIVGMVYRTCPPGHEDAVPLDLLMTILGQGASSRLYRRLVAEEQLAVVASTMQMSLEQDGIAVAVAVLPPVAGDAEAAWRAIQAEVNRLRDEKVSHRELTKARNQMLRGMITSSLRVSSKASLLGNAAVVRGDVSSVNRRLEEMRSITADDLQRVARQYLDPERALTVHIKSSVVGTVSGALGRLFGAKEGEEEAPVTAEPEKVAPPPGRPGLKRPADFPVEPPEAEMKDLKVTPHFSTHVLGNGMKVIVVPNHEVPFVSVRLGLLAGAWTEEKAGSASMAMQMLTKGTAHHTEAELAEELAYHAISLGGGAGMDTASVTTSCLSEHLERAMSLLAEVVREPTFPEVEFNKLRKQIRTGLVVDAAVPSYVAGRELRQRLYGDHPYARTPSGEPEDVDLLTVEDLESWWATFVRPDLSVLIFSGAVDEEQAVRLAREAFGDWNVPGDPPALEPPALPEAAATHIYLVDRPELTQSQIRLGQLGITRKHPGYFTTRVINGYFGGAFGSRLNRNIRVEQGLTYGIGGGYYPRRFAGTFQIGTFTKTESAAEAVRAILDELDRLRGEPPTDEELSMTQSYVLGSFPAGRETPQQVAGDLWLIESHDLPADYFEQLLAQVADTKAQDCLQLVQETVDPSKMVLVVVGNAEGLKDDLEMIAPVTVVPAKEEPEPTAEKREAR